MARNEDYLKNLQNMNQAELKKTLMKVMGTLSAAQQSKVKGIASDKAKLNAVRSKLRPEDIEGLKAHLGSTEELKAYLQRPDIQKRISEIL